MKITPSLITAAITLAASTPLFAASASSSSVTSTDSSDSGVVLDKLVIEGKAVTESQPESSVSVITSDEIEKSMSTNVEDLVRYEPGVGVTKDDRFGIGSINVRGLDGDRVKITIDGVEQTDGYGPTTTYLRAGRTAVDLDSLEQVEIVKGGDVTEGSGALGGVVKFRTKEPASFLNSEGDDTYIAVKAGYRSASSEISKTATIANRTGDLESLLVYTRRDGHDTENNGDQTGGVGVSRGLNDPGDTDSDNVLAKVQYQLNDENRIGLVAEHYVADSAFDLLSESSATATRTVDNRSDDETKRTRLGISHENTHANAAYDSMKWQLDYQKTRTTNGTYIDTTTLSSGTVSHRYVDRFYEDESTALRADFNKKVGAHTARYGFNYDYKTLENLNKNTVDGVTATTRFSPVADGKIFGAYVEDSWAVTDRFRLLPAVRYDHYSYSTSGDEYIDAWGDNSNRALTAQIGTEFDLTRNYSVFGKYGTGFRAPDMDDLYYYFENAGTGYAYRIKPNPDLKPEHSLFLEGGFRADGTYGSGEITAFYNRYRDFIEQVSLGASATYNLGEYTNVNIDRVLIKGLEVKGQLNLDQVYSAIPNGWALKGAAAYADGKNQEDNEPLDSIAPLTVVLGLSYDSPSSRWGSRLNWTWVDSKKAKDITSSNQWLAIPSYSKLDLTGYYKPFEKLTVSAGLFNITDEKYWVWNDIRNLTNSSENLDRYSEAGRNVGVDVTYEF